MDPRTFRRAFPVLAFLALAFLAACGGGTGRDLAPADLPVADVQDASDDALSPDAIVPEDRPGPGDAPDDPSPDPAPDLPADAPADSTSDLPADLPPGDAAPDVPLSPACEDGTPRRPFQDTPESTALFAPAADLTIPTTDGPWSLKANWTGCESLLFLQDRPAQNGGWPDTLFTYNVNFFLYALPKTAHVFFASVRDPVADGQAALATLKGRVEAVLGYLSPADAESLRRRIHYVSDHGRSLPSWLGSLMRSPGWGVGVDRFQRIRYVGSYADYAQYDAAKQWFAPNLRMAANEAVYYDFEATREAALEAANATVIPVFAGTVVSDPNWAGAKGTADVTLPDAATMATFDTLELDLTLACNGDGEYGTCPAWDYIANLYLCDRDTPGTCDVELGRWITTYHRWGRWVHDVTPLLPLLKDGGTRRLAFYTQQAYRVGLSLRLSNRGRATKPAETHFLFPGGEFGPAYNDGRAPATVPIPADARRVTLAVAVTGHGGVQPDNCAEFCSPTHTFTVNGVAHDIRFTEPGDPEGCMKQVAQGTVPNQYGTWWYGRNGWCPGREVPLKVLDVTADVTPGQDATVAYQGLYNGAPYPSGGAGIVMTSWLVVER